MKTNNQIDPLQAVAEWQAALQAMEEAFSPLRAAFANSPNGPLPEAVDALGEAYTRLIARVTGGDYDMLMDWWIVHDFGSRPMMAGLDGEPMRELSSNEQLLAFIEDCRPSYEKDR